MKADFLRTIFFFLSILSLLIHAGRMKSRGFTGDHCEKAKELHAVEAMTAPDVQINVVNEAEGEMNDLHACCDKDRNKTLYRIHAVLGGAYFEIFKKEFFKGDRSKLLNR